MEAFGGECFTSILSSPRGGSVGGGLPPLPHTQGRLSCQPLRAKEPPPSLGPGLRTPVGGDPVPTRQCAAPPQALNAWRAASSWEPSRAGGLDEEGVFRMTGGEPGVLGCRTLRCRFPSSGLTLRLQYDSAAVRLSTGGGAPGGGGCISQCARQPQHRTGLHTRSAERRKGGQVGGRVDKWMDGWMDRWMGQWTDGWMT